MSALQQQIQSVLAEHNVPLKQAWIVNHLRNKGYLVKQPSVARALETQVRKKRIIRTVCREYHLPGVSLSANEHARQKFYRDYPPGHKMRTEAVTCNAALLTMVNISYRGLMQGRFVGDHGCEEIQNAVRDDKLNLTTAIKIILISDSDDEQRGWLHGSKFEIKCRVNAIFRIAKAMDDGDQ